MTIHHIVHVEGLGALTDLVQMIYEELNVMNTSPVEVIDGKDPAVQKALGIQEEKPMKPTNTRRRWTSVEENIVIGGYSRGLTPASISEILKSQGFERNSHAIVSHMSELRKLTK